MPLCKVWAVLDAPAGKRLAPFLPEIVSVLERAGELELEAAVRAKLVSTCCCGCRSTTRRGGFCTSYIPLSPLPPDRRPLWTRRIDAR